ncbi:DUF2232 domain-containing protein [Methylocapsa sp. S129]|uniref:DUF2232 domain-containing protein n=1 Tax=Methylocapsa sp. S129 TaxID=1641869 RepID=UPI00131B4760|nr:DUF2232 domain-containing protein [Methylocapsa sp. S129]
MMQRIGIAIGAGLAAALLFVVTAKGTLLAILLAYLSPLPIVIASLGWGLDMGALAAAIASVVAAALIDPLSGGVFAASIALPPWLLSAAALLPRQKLYPRAAAANGEKTWFPVGGIVAIAALMGALVGAGMLASMILDYGGYQNGVDAMAAKLIPRLRDAFDDVMTLPSDITIEDFAATIVRLFPAVLAASTCLMFCANFYAGARAVQLSHRLKRPWPNLPEGLVLPQFLGIGLIACAGLALSLRGSGEYVAWIGVGALGCAYVMQGLAVVHSLSRGLPVRIPALIALYLGCMVTARWSLPALALVGLVESLLSLRARRAAAANAKP